MQTMKNFYEQALMQGCSAVMSDALRSARVPQIAPLPWTEGCRINIPYNYAVFAQPVCDESGREHSVLFVAVSVEFPNGEHQMDRLYLGTLTKTALPVDGSPRVIAHGKAVDFIRSYQNWNDALEALKGNTLKVSAVHRVEVKAFPHCDCDTVRVTRVYDFDFA